MAEAYSNFAAVYDALMDNIPYDAWADYLHGLLVEYDIASGILAELGCGTGNITERMADFGYDMIGIDNSPAMLDIANESGNKIILHRSTCVRTCASLSYTEPLQPS